MPQHTPQSHPPPPTNRPSAKARRRPAHALRNSWPPSGTHSAPRVSPARRCLATLVPGAPTGAAADPEALSAAPPSVRRCEGNSRAIKNLMRAAAVAQSTPLALAPMAVPASASPPPAR
jgi:hypothetical protein